MYGFYIFLDKQDAALPAAIKFNYNKPVMMCVG